MRRALSTLVAVAVTAGCLWFLLTPQIVKSLGRLAAEARPWPILAAFLLGCLVQWLRAWRFAVLTTGRLELPGAPLVRIAFQLNALNFILPFRLGELSYPVLMRRQYGSTLMQSAGVLLLARLFDLATVASILVGAAAWLKLANGVNHAVLVGAATALALAPFGLALAAPILRGQAARLPRVGDLATRATAGFAAIGDRRAAMLAVALGFVLWLTIGLAAVLVAGAVVATVPPAAAVLGIMAGSVAFALPVNGIAGVGPAQAAWVLVTTLAGVPFNDAVLSALALHAVVLTNAVVLGGLATVPASGRSGQ
jgi:uncharacterized membrane protein YbhN (UPF0104 family)